MGEVVVTAIKRMTRAVCLRSHSPFDNVVYMFICSCRRPPTDADILEHVITQHGYDATLTDVFVSLESMRKYVVRK